jgi:serine/threonine protein kinase
VASSVAPIAEPLPGYTLSERIGAGGYGEVWKVEAPGGLTKALKFVHGRLDDQKAASEFRALSRIRQVRHPFLLSLERIEVVDGQLLIVTELADESLWDRFEACRRAGLRGIPREELLGYLNDAAEALDYMCENFSLQHLDIKPENLLLVGGRAKVADFGLVQDIADPQRRTDPSPQGGSADAENELHESSSVLGGLTPVYASPEVYHGRPSVQSDQYSLAIVYQQLLTGTLPFPGRTVAQLRTQHLHSRPQLTSLPSTDRRAIFKALAKEPQGRFPSCRALVAALVDPDRHRPGADSAAVDAPRAPSRDSTTTAAYSCFTNETEVEPFSSSPLAPCSAEAVSAAEPAPEALPEPQPTAVLDLKPIDVPADAAVLRPTLWLGIGGTAARVLQRLRRRLADRFGDPSSLPAFRTVLIDTDTSSVAAALQSDEGAAFEARDTLAMPLRKPQHYRNQAHRYLRWLSRRWLYNIPRSLQTDGYRPFGRLAFVDHAAEVARQLRAILESLVTEDALAATAEASGLEIRDRAPRVFVIASISGGTGSGMLFDVAAAVRSALDELGIVNADLCGLLTHSTGRSPRHQELAIANAYACLREWQYYHQHACSAGREPLFRHTYLVSLGEKLDDTAFEAAADNVAAYLELDAVTAAAAFFEQSRQSPTCDPESSAPSPRLRTFSVCQVGCSHGPTLDFGSVRLCQEVLDRWCDGPPDGDEPDRSTDRGEPPSASAADARRACADEIRRLADEFVAEQRLAFKGLWEQSHEALSEQLGTAPDRLLDELFLLARDKAAAASHNSARTLTAADFLNSLSDLLGPRDPRQSRHRATTAPLREAVRTRLAQLAEEGAAALQARLCTIAETPSLRMCGAQQTAECLLEHSRTLEEHARQQGSQTDERLAELESKLLGVRSKSRGRRRLPLFGNRLTRRLTVGGRRLGEYLQKRVSLVVLQLIRDTARTMRDRTSAAMRELAERNQRLGLLRSGLAAPAGQADSLDRARDSGDAVDRLRARVCEEMQRHMPQLADDFDRRLPPELLAEWGVFRDAAERGPQRAFLAALRAQARAAIRAALAQAEVGGCAFLPAEPDCRAVLDGAFALAAPSLLEHGGTRRFLAAVPEHVLQSPMGRHVDKQLENAASIAGHACGDLLLCCEAQDLDLDNVAALLIGTRGKCLRMAARLHTRTDVSWNASRH